MTLCSTQPRHLINKQPVDRLPACAGVYRFFSANNSLLYVGKSIDIYKRVQSHWRQAREPGQHQKMMAQVAAIEASPTAGEWGALLIENAAIKAEQSSHFTTNANGGGASYLLATLK